MITQLSLVPSKNLTQRQAPISPQEPVSTEKTTAPEKLEGGLEKVGLMTDSLRPPRDTKEWFCVDLPSQTDSESRSASSRDNSPENSQANSPMKCSQSTTSSPREICLPPPLLSLPPLSPPRKADKSSSSNSSTPFNKSSFQPTLAGVESASNGLPTPPPSENCDPSFIRTMPPEVIFDVFFSYLTPDEAVDVLSVVNESQKDLFVHYKEKRCLPENRVDLKKHREESLREQQCFFEIEEILKNYSNRVSKQFFTNLPPELLQELNAKLTPELREQLDKELSEGLSPELSNKVSAEFKKQVSPLSSFNRFSKKLTEGLTQEFSKMLTPKVLTTLKKLIYDLIDFIYFSYKKSQASIFDLKSLKQLSFFYERPELISKIFDIFEDCEIPCINTAHTALPVDFRVGFFATRYAPDVSNAIFGAILTNDFPLLDFALNTANCTSDEIIHGVFMACSKLAQWAEKLNEFFDYCVGKKQYKPERAFEIYTHHGQHFLNSFFNARPYIKYAIYKAAEFSKKEETKKNYKDMINIYTYENDFVPKFNRFKAAYSNKANLIRKWEIYNKTKFIPSPLATPLQTYTWSLFDNFFLRLLVWQNSTSKYEI